MGHFSKCLAGVRKLDSDRLWVILTLKGAFGVQNAMRFVNCTRNSVEPIDWFAVSIVRSPASRIQILGVN